MVPHYFGKRREKQHTSNLAIVSRFQSDASNISWSRRCCFGNRIVAVGSCVRTQQRDVLIQLSSLCQENGHRTNTSMINHVWFTSSCGIPILTTNMCHSVQS